MYVLCVLAASALPQAPPVLLGQAPPVSACPCGAACECPPGECRCPDCPHRSEAVAPEWLAFSAVWCGRCKGCEYPVGVRVVDFDKEEALAKACGVTALP